MLRTALLIFSCLLVALGLYLCATLPAPAMGGIQALVSGVVLLVAMLFERWRYRNRNASPEGNWQATGERFIDPETGKQMEVLYDPTSGERRYRELESG